MKTEEKLKAYILTRYKSIREFVAHAGIPYTTMDGILKRGVDKASIGNILTICRVLGISADELGRGEIIPLQGAADKAENLQTVVQLLGLRIMNGELTLDGVPLNETQKHDAVVLLETVVEYLRKKRG